MTTTHRPFAPSGSAAADAPCDAPCAERSRARVLAATILASSMGFIDGSVVHIALPAIQADLGASFAALQWVVNGYMLMLGALLLAGGALGDQAGRRRVFVAGIGLFVLASIACALAGDATTLIVARCIQGIGAALMIPQSLAIIAASFPREVRGRAIGTWAAASALTTAAGPVLGGLLIDLASWRGAFWINVPLGAVAIALTLRHVPESRAARAEPIDWAGALTITVALGLITWALTAWPRAEGAAGAVALGIGLAGLAAAAMFLAVERRVVAPMLPPMLLGDRPFLALNAMTVLLYFALSGVLFLLPYNLIQVQGLSASSAGLLLLPLGLIIGLLSRPAGRLADRIGPRPQLVAGPVVVALGAAALAVPGTGGAAWIFALPVAVVGLGMAISVSPLTTTVMNCVPEARSGAASGVNNAASRVAGLFAVALSGAVATVVFAVALDAELAATALDPAVQDALRAQVDRLAEASAPAGTAPEASAQAERAVADAYVDAFRGGVLLNAACAGLAAALAFVTVRGPLAEPPTAGG